MSIKYKCVKNITVKAFFVDFYYGILGKTEYIIIVCKTEGYVEDNSCYICLSVSADGCGDMVCCIYGRSVWTICYTAHMFENLR